MSRMSGVEQAGKQAAVERERERERQESDLGWPDGGTLNVSRETTPDLGWPA